MSSSQSGQVSHSIVIDADPASVFDVLVDPSQHQLFDGSGTVKGSISGPPRLYLGATFSMRMHWFAPYAIRNTVVDYEEDRRIGWRHFARHVWRYHLEPTEGEHGVATKVTETFDFGRAPLSRVYAPLGFISNADSAIPASLQRLKTLVESRAVIRTTK